MNAATVLDIKNLVVEFPRPGASPHITVNGASLQIAPGEVVGLVGESGSGKTMMALSSMGLIPAPGRASSGEVIVKGTDLLKASPSQCRQIRGRDVGMVFQDPLSSLNPVRPIGSLLIQSAMDHQAVPRREAEALAIAMLDSVGIPHAKERLYAYPHEFSGGQRQRIMIALAAMNAPPLIVADEPTTALDATIERQVLTLLKEQASQSALLLITHDLRIAAEICDSISVMRKGQIIEAGPAHEIIQCPQEGYTKKLLDAVPQFGKRPFFAIDKERLQEKPNDQTPLLEAKNVEVAFRSPDHGLFKVLEQISFKVLAGESIGIVGESGSGKSTIAKTIMQILSPQQGEICFEGAETQKKSRKALKAFRRRVQMVFQDPYASLDPRWRVGDIIAEPLRAQSSLSKRDIKDRVEELIVQVGLPNDASKRLPVQFSGGQRQRICLARALTLTPDILIADEPLSSLDVTIQWKIAELLKELQRQYKLALLFIAHDLPLVYQLTERVIVLYLGQIVEEGPTLDIFNKPKHPYTAALLVASGKKGVAGEGLLKEGLGEPGSIFTPPSGCRFHPRCPMAQEQCRTEMPALTNHGQEGRVACHFPGELSNSPL